MTSRKKNILSSASVSFSPSTSACTSAVMTSSAGSWRLRSASSSA
jgi:hypothetical protein